MLAQVYLMQHLSGEAHALAVGYLAALIHAADDISALYRGNGEYQQSVVDKHLIAHTELIGKILIADRNARLVSLDIIGSEHKAIALTEDGFLIFKGAYTVLGSLGIEHYRERNAELASHRLDKVNLLLMLLVSAMGKIQSCDVHPRFYHIYQSLLILAGGSYRTYYLRLSHHVILPCTSSDPLGRSPAVAPRLKYRNRAVRLRPIAASAVSYLKIKFIVIVSKKRPIVNNSKVKQR